MSELAAPPPAAAAEPWPPEAAADLRALRRAIEQGEAPGQAIIASESSQIANIQQTIVHGDLYLERPGPAAAIGQLFIRYQAFLIESFSSLDFRGMLQLQSATRVWLNQIYIVGRARAADAAPEQAPQDLHSLLRAHQRLVVLGDPGSGKSTFVRYVLLALARGDSAAQLGLEPAWLPILFPIAAFSAARLARPDLAPLQYLGEYYAGLSQPDYRPLFERALRLGRAMVLLDGLDEVRSDRRGIVGCLEAFVREWHSQGNRFVATSRTVGYDDAPLDEGLFTSATIEPLADEQIRQVVERWCRAYETIGLSQRRLDDELLGDLVRAASEEERERRIAAQIASLSAAVFGDQHVTSLARNPLLLTILALVHQQGARLPNRRVELYRLCVEALAETWNRARSLSGRPVDVYLGDEPLDERFVINLLGPVALWIHGEQPGGLVEQPDLELHIAETLVKTDGLARGRALRLAQDFIELVRRDTGLLQERGYRRFGFMHLTFEEYLAARGLLESVAVADPMQLIQRYCLLPRWREVVRLAVAAAPQREAQRLLLEILAAPTGRGQRAQPAILAGECLVDIGRNSASGRAWAAGLTALLRLVGDPAMALAERLAAGELLGQLGDPRRLDPESGESAGGAEHGLPSYWCDLAAGDFWAGDERGQGRGPRLRRHSLARPLRIARYPISVDEYAAFIRAGGYEERRWWSAAGWACIQPGGPRAARISAPALWESPAFSGPAQPVVGVSWYEAEAYCAWLTAAGRRAGWLGERERLRLPTALEWERAARHTDRRSYPWGNARPDGARAGFAGLGLRAPAPVGCFPAGAAACGALDMAGNIWEWTASRADDPARPAPQAGLAADQPALVKGGAFSWDQDALRCGALHRFGPGQRSNLLGFRLLRAPDEDQAP